MFSYEPDILSRPASHFGIWTPEGWRIHKRCFDPARKQEVAFSGNGVEACFNGLPHGFSDVIHDRNDPYSDRGIYPSEPRVEYPPGRPRWAVSHTFLTYPHADQELYVQEYTWNRKGTLETHFRHHVVGEEAMTDDQDGLTVRVRHRPISQVVVGNKAYPFCNSAVRGVWANENLQGVNYYTKEHVMLLSSYNAIYIKVPYTPVVQCRGIWKAEERDRAAFDEGGWLMNRDLLLANGIPLEAPELSALGYELREEKSAFYGRSVRTFASGEVRIDERWMAALNRCKGFPFSEHGSGFAAWSSWKHMEHIWGVPGFYCPQFDYNRNGIVDDADEAILKNHLGLSLRTNHYSAGYFGNDWLSTGVLLNPEMHVHVPVICQWVQGAGYSAQEGVIHLFKTPGPNRKVYIEYHYDAPAQPGEDNIRVHLTMPD